MSNLSVFDFNSTEVRVVLVNGEPWFVAKDVCEILGLVNVSKSCNPLRDKDKGITSSDTLGGNQNMVIISEFGLYELVLGSRKPEAKNFKYWICDEVIPSIRKTGGYSVSPQSKLPSRQVAVETASSIKFIKDTLEDTDPRLAQFLIDYAISDIISTQNLLTGDRLRGVVEIATDLGYSVNSKNRGQLGKFVKANCGELAQQEERLVNGTLRKVGVFPDNEIVRSVIAQFFS